MRAPLSATPAPSWPARATVLARARGGWATWPGSSTLPHGESFYPSSSTSDPVADRDAARARARPPPCRRRSVPAAETCSIRRRPRRLATTIFERLLAPARPRRDLWSRHRMHRASWRSPCVDVRRPAVAAPRVAGWTLADLGVAPDPLRPLRACADRHRRHRLPEYHATDAHRGVDSEHPQPGSRRPGRPPRCGACCRAGRAGRPGVIAITTPQSRLLRELLASRRAAGVEVGTVEGLTGARRRSCGRTVSQQRSRRRRLPRTPPDERRAPRSALLLLVADSATRAASLLRRAARVESSPLAHCSACRETRRCWTSDS